MLSAQQLFEDPMEQNSIIHPKNSSIRLLQLVRYVPQNRRPMKKMIYHRMKYQSQTFADGRGSGGNYQRRKR